VPQVKTEKPTVSSSKMDTMMRCQMQYYFRYIEGLLKPPGVALILGTATHTSIEANLVAKMDGTPITREEAIDIAADALRNEWLGQAPKLDDFEKSLGKRVVQGRAIDMAGALAALHHGDVAPKITPISIERAFVLELDGYPLDIRGRIDIEEERTIGDTKTKGGKGPGEEDAHQSLQLTTYALAKRTFDGGRMPDGLYLDFLVKTKVPYETRLETTRCEADFDSLLEQVVRHAAVLESGSFYPTHPSNWICSQRFCGYWQDDCPFGRRRRVQI